jgi:hypothetical protein
LCRYHLFDGTSLGNAEICIDVPLGFHDDNKIEEKIFEKSKRILVFQDISHCEYDGTAILATDSFGKSEQGHQERFLKKMEASTTLACAFSPALQPFPLLELRFC